MADPPRAAGEVHVGPLGERWCPGAVRRTGGLAGGGGPANAWIPRDSPFQESSIPRRGLRLPIVCQLLQGSVGGSGGSCPESMAPAWALAPPGMYPTGRALLTGWRSTEPRGVCSVQPEGLAPFQASGLRCGDEGLFCLSLTQAGQGEPDRAFRIPRQASHSGTEWLPSLSAVRTGWERALTACLQGSEPRERPRARAQMRTGSREVGA